MIVDVKMQESTIWDRVIWLLTTVLFASFCIFDTNALITYILIAITALLLLVIAIKNNFRIPISFGAFHVMVLVFAAFCLMSSLWATRKGVAIQRGITVIEILICMSVLYIYYHRREDAVEKLLKAVMWSGYIVAVYAFFFYGFGEIRAVLEAEDERLQTTFSNINTIAMVSALAVVICLFFVLFYHARWSALFSLPCIVMVAASGSKKALLLLLIGFFVLIIKRVSTKNLIKTAFKVIITIAIFLGVVYCVLSLPMFSGIMDRMVDLIDALTDQGGDRSSILRRAFIEAGFATFLEHPIAGIGMGNSGLITLESTGLDTYLHNNYVELLACGGIVGFLCFYGMHWFVGNKMIRYRKHADRTAIMCWCLLILMIFLDVGQVSYFSKTTYFYFLILFIQVEKMRRYKRSQA